MRIRHILLLFSLSLFFVLQAQEEDKPQFYSFGIGFEHDFFITKTRMANLNYFTTNYSNGTATSIFFKNQIKLSDWFARVDVGYGIARQKQKIVFSNALDPIIDFDILHNLHLWQLNYGFGRFIRTEKKIDFLVQMGASTYGYFFGPGSGEKTGTFDSRYYDYSTSLWSGQELTETYSYEINYRGIIDIVPWLKFGGVIKTERGTLEFGINYKFNRLYYQNFITIRSQNYTAIANSRSASNSVGLFLNYFF